MNSLEKFFKNRISFTVRVNLLYYTHHNVTVKKSNYFQGKIYNPQRLNIINTFDLVEN